MRFQFTADGEPFDRTSVEAETWAEALSAVNASRVDPSAMLIEDTGGNIIGISMVRADNSGRYKAVETKTFRLVKGGTG